MEDKRESGLALCRVLSCSRLAWCLVSRDGPRAVQQPTGVDSSKARVIRATGPAPPVLRFAALQRGWEIQPPKYCT